MTHAESVELTNLEHGKLSEEQIRRIFRYARIMLNIFRLPQNAHGAIKDLEQELEDTNLDFDEEGFMVTRAALCFLVRASERSQFYVTEEYDLGISHEQGFRFVIDGNTALERKAEYASGLAVDVCFIPGFRNSNLVNFDRPITLSKQEEFIIKTRIEEELNGEQIKIFTEPI